MKILQIIQAPENMRIIIESFDEDTRSTRTERFRAVCFALVEEKNGSTHIRPAIVDGGGVDIETPFLRVASREQLESGEDISIYIEQF